MRELVNFGLYLLDEYEGFGRRKGKLFEEKHLPGQHKQKLHGRDRGSSSGRDSEEQIGLGGEIISVDNRLGKAGVKYVDAIIYQMGSIPASMRIVGGASSRVTIRNRPKDVPKYAQAHFQPIGGGSKYGYIHIYPVKGQDQIEVAGNAVHEYGHAVDLFLGSPSQRTDFANAIDEDESRLGPIDRGLRYGYILESRAEVFAETYAALAGARGRPEDNETYLKKFPRSSDWVRSVLGLGK